LEIQGTNFEEIKDLSLRFEEKIEKRERSFDEEDD